MAKIKLSILAYNELAAACEAQGMQVGTSAEGILISKGDTLVRPIDWRMATVRKDCLVEAVKCEHDNIKNILCLADEMLQYVLHGRKENENEKANNEKPETKSK